MRIARFQLVVGALVLGLAACSADIEADGAADSAGSDAAAPEAGDAVTGDADETGAAAQPAPAGQVAGGDASGASGAAAGSLTAYVGKYPFDEVGGVAWDDHPVVRAGIRNTVSDGAVRETIFSLGGPSAPISTYEGKVGAWSCEAHNCGGHQWAVLVDPATGVTDVCYHNAGQAMAGRSRWFLADGSEETRSGNCSVL